MARDTDQSAKPKRTGMDAFLEHMGRIDEHLAELRRLADDHLGYGPDEITWAHAGTAEHLADELGQLADWLLKRGEFAA